MCICNVGFLYLLNQLKLPFPRPKSSFLMCIVSWFGSSFPWPASWSFFLWLTSVFSRSEPSFPITSFLRLRSRSPGPSFHWSGSPCIRLWSSFFWFVSQFPRFWSEFPILRFQSFFFWYRPWSWFKNRFLFTLLFFMFCFTGWSVPYVMIWTSLTIVTSWYSYVYLKPSTANIISFIIIIYSVMTILNTSIFKKYYYI